MRRNDAAPLLTPAPLSAPIAPLLAESAPLLTHSDVRACPPITPRTTGAQWRAACGAGADAALWPANHSAW